VPTIFGNHGREYIEKRSKLSIFSNLRIKWRDLILAHEKYLHDLRSRLSFML